MRVLVFFVLGLFTFHIAGGAGLPKLEVLVEGRSDPIFLADPRPAMMARDGLSIELVEVLGALLVRGRDGLLRAVSPADCSLIERIGERSPHFALTLRDRRILEGELLTALAGRSSRGRVELAPPEIRSFWWAGSPPESGRFRSYFEEMRREAIRVRLGAAPGRVAYELELDAVWFAFFEDDRKRPLYQLDLTLGHSEAWEIEVDFRTIRRVVFDRGPGPLTAKVEVEGLRPFFGVEVFAQWARLRDLRRTLYVMGLDGPVLYAIPISSIEALSRPPGKAVAKTASPDAGDRWEVTVIASAGPRTLKMVDVRPVYSGGNSILEMLIGRVELVVLEGPNGELAATTPAHVRRGHRDARAKAMTAVLADQRVIEGRLRCDLLGRTPYGQAHVSAGAILGLVTSSRGDPGPLDLGWSSEFTARVGKTGGARRDFAGATWLHVPGVTAPAGRVRTSNLLTLRASGRVERIATESILAVSRNPHANSPRWHVMVFEGPTLFGDLCAAPECSSGELASRRQRWSTWIGGFDGAAAYFVPMDAVESLTIEGQRQPVAQHARAMIEIRDAVPPKRYFDRVEPFFEPRRGPAFLETATVAHHAFILEERAGIYALALFDAVEVIESVDRGRVRVLVSVHHAKKPTPITGRPLCGLEGHTRHGSTRIAPADLAGYLPQLSEEEPTLGPWGKVKSQTKLRIRLFDGETFDLDYVFFVDEAWKGSIRWPAYVHKFVLEVEGEEELKNLDALQEARFGAAGNDRAPVPGEVRMADGPLRKGIVQLLTRIDRGSERGVPDRHDLLCGDRRGVVRCVEIRRIESLQRRRD